MNKVVVTGATGFIGSHLCELLLNDGTVVIGLDIDPKKLEKFTCYKNFIPIIADFSKYDYLHKMINHDDIDVFYHLAWQGVCTEQFKNAELQLNNAVYAIKAFDAAIKIGCKKFVFAGTFNEYEVQTIATMDEYPARYTNIYGSSKFAADMILRSKSKLENIEYISGLISMVYGEGITAPNLVNVVLKNLIMGTSPKLVQGDNLYDLVYVNDVAKAFKAIGENGHNMNRYYIGHRNLKTFREYIEEMRDIISPEVNLMFGEYNETQLIDFNIIDTEKLYRDTGFECEADFKETMLKTAEYVKSLM